MNHSSLITKIVFVLAATQMAALTAHPTEFGPMSYSADRRGLDRASRYCASLSMSSDREECMDVVRQARYMHDDATRICIDLSFQSERLECFEVIRDKYYYEGDIRIIERESFESNKIDLLRKWGVPYESPIDGIDRREIRRGVVRALDHLEKRELNQVKEELELLLRKLSSR